MRNGDEALLSIIFVCRGISVKIFITLESHSTFGSYFAYLYIVSLSSYCDAKLFLIFADKHYLECTNKLKFCRTLSVSMLQAPQKIKYISLQRNSTIWYILIHLFTIFKEMNNSLSTHMINLRTP